MEATKEQQKAINGIERALKKARDSGLKISWSDYGSIVLYDKETYINCEEVEDSVLDDCVVADISLN